MKALKIILGSCLIIISLSANAQYNIKNINHFDNDLESGFENLTFQNIDFNTYQVSFFKAEYSNFSSTLSMRIEDEINSEDTYVLLNDISFLDINFNYSIGLLDFRLTLENLLNINDNGFAIEPYLDNNIVNFSHETNFLLRTSIAYKF